ncbi:glycine--tRNA ligase subunit beta [Candidatus Azoamicus ciliaticola]|uniref:Glycine--tRNA ligase beta subunit n=1 Tax=Candidatus Azoamicus ciliaticola TaxID=2652803 RepID=A0A6J5JVC2_9GAMM|nr:glycine--tRNA ligase subunit beta [Candidatus Azoamicus ciliaticola]CAB3976238.1 Glycine--tRNA ligase beta subunit [Candidatus Azoamicus ciliaticola]
MKNNKNNILIEIGTEELPYKNLHKLSENFKDIIRNNAPKLNINFSLIKNFITSRRIAFIIEINEDEKNINIKEKLKSLINNSLNEIKFNIKMRWHNYTTEFIRPVKWYILLIDNKIIKHTIFNIKSKNITLAHKTLKKELKVNANNYETSLEKNGYVICDYKKRKNLVLKLIKNYTKTNKLNIILKRSSINDVTNLVEYPSIIICNFKKIFLKIPKEIITTVLLKNHFCFLLTKKNKLINKLIIISDVIRKTKEIKIGYEYIINTKLSELNFLYENDKKIIKKFNIYDLKKLTLNDKIGNIYEKTLRVKNLVKFIKNKLNIKSKNILNATKFIKIDMLTKIVTEIPELNGLIYSSSLENKYIRKHLYNYNRTINNKVKKNIISAIISLADMIDNITSFFILGKIPTSSKDPFNLKKDSKIIIKIIIKNKININIKEVIEQALFLHKNKNNIIAVKITNFIAQKITNIKTQQQIENILKIKNIQELIEKITRYRFKENLTTLIKRIQRITEKNKTNLQKKINKKLLIKTQEKVLFINIKKHLNIINILNKQNLFFECAKTFLMIEKHITSYFKDVLVLDKDIDIKHNRLKLLNIIKKIAFNKVNLNFFV